MVGVNIPGNILQPQGFGLQASVLPAPKYNRIWDNYSPPSSSTAKWKERIDLQTQVCAKRRVSAWEG